MKSTIFSVAMLMLLGLALPVQADIAVKFAGDIAPDTSLSNKSNAVVNAFFDDPELADGRSRGDFACFEGDLVSLVTRRRVGTGVDCLRIAGVPDTTMAMTPLGDIANTADLSAAIDAITFFFLPGGYLVNDGLTTVRPFFSGIGDGDGAVSHITGSFPGLESGVVAGTGRFAKWVGKAKVRLSGSVDLLNPPNTFFSCIFVIEKYRK